MDAGFLFWSDKFGATRRLKRATGVKPFSPHALRRTMAIHSLCNGINIYLLARMLGRADIHVLKHYRFTQRTG
ncbi:tyrosine-type recombinase/integrase [Caldilinea sp.]|uniref:tyrosine-type recombinase/integrase n=1 Tax=Caldilinea sp. TaxID=2293560 RepID=UPI0035B5439C